jgi:hypothetical protein
MRNNDLRKAMWNQRIESARRTLAPGQETKVWKHRVSGEPPEEFSLSVLSFPKGAKTVYRDSNATNSLQIREYDEYFQIQMDHYHPLRHPLGHIAQDISNPVAQAATSVALGLALGVGGSLIGSAMK